MCHALTGSLLVRPDCGSPSFPRRHPRQHGGTQASTDSAAVASTSAAKLHVVRVSGLATTTTKDTLEHFFSSVSHSRPPTATGSGTPDLLSPRTGAVPGLTLGEHETASAARSLASRDRAKARPTSPSQRNPPPRPPSSSRVARSRATRSRFSRTRSSRPRSRSRTRPRPLRRARPASMGSTSR